MGRPTVGAAVPCRPRGFGRGDRENGERRGDFNTEAQRHRGTEKRERISHAENAENAERGEPIGG